MKKLILSLVAVFALNVAVQAQDYDFTVGVRVGYGAAFTTEISAQAFTNDINRLELDLGLRFPDPYTRTVDGETIKDKYPMGPILTPSYQWHWFLAGGFGFYLGPAVQLSLPYWHHFCMGAGGQVGFDFQFDAPFQFAVDFRPIYNFFGYYKGFDPNVGISLRYAF